MAGEACPSCGGALAPEPGATLLRRCAVCRSQVLAPDAATATLMTATAPGVRAPAAQIPLSEEFRARWQLGRVVGAGVTGTVYEARPRDGGPPVAIKLLTRPDRDDLLQRFLREARLLGELAHPHVVQVQEVGVTGGYPYLVCELMAGGTLEEALERSGTLPVGDVVQLGLDVLEGLHAAHSRGIVHRDLKPANVLLTRGHRAKLADFGLAKHFGQVDAASTLPGRVMGTPLYMAPEQLLGSRVGTAADVFAVGVILYRALTGELPYPGRTLAEIAVAHVHGRVPGVRERANGVPDALHHVVMRALSVKPVDRPQTAEDFAVPLRRLANRVPARPQAPPSAPAALRVPKVGAGPWPASFLARYRPEGLLHASRTSRLFRAHHVPLGLPVVVRLAHGDDPVIEACRARYQHEAQILSRFQHPHLVGVLEVDLESTPWIVYEQLAGPSLRAVRAGKALSADYTLTAVKELLLALGALHRAGWIHRGIKSERLVRDERGYWKLTALRSAAPPGAREPGLVGTASYMAPEVCEGQPHTEASDLYAAGVVLYECLVGRLPFKGRDPAHTRELQQTMPLKPPGRRANLSPGVELILQRALQKRPADRYASAADFARAIANVD